MTLGSPARSIGIHYVRIPTENNAVTAFPFTTDAATPTAVQHNQIMASHDDAPAHVRWTLSHHEVIPTQPPISLPAISDYTPIRPRAPSPTWPSIPSSRSPSPPSPTSPTSFSQIHASPDSHSRGRPRTHTTNLHPNALIKRATSRRLARPSSIDHGTYSTASSSPAQDYTLLEPLPFDHINTSLSEILTRSSTFSPIDTHRFGGHRDTFALLEFRPCRRHAPELPLEIFARLAAFLDGESYLAMRLICRCWSAALTCVRPVKVRAARRLPTEVLMLVWGYLGPRDFDAARRVCRGWFAAGLETGVLGRMLRVGGWWSAWEADLEVLGVGKRGSLGKRESVVGEEWAMSKRLAVECSLRPGWGGNGVDQKLVAASSLVLTSETDFSELGNGYAASPDDDGAALHFTVSVCGKFVLVAEGCVIYVYRLSSLDQRQCPYGGHLEPLTSIICPRRVLAVSMDTSSQRYAVAALLNDRMGLVCDINPLTYGRPASSQRAEPDCWERQDYRASVLSSQNSGERIVTEQARSEAEHLSAQSYLRSQARHARAAAFQPIIDPNFSMSPISPVLSEDFSGIPVETGPRSIYRALCSPDDPPLSVAICPQRRCVAFGCSAGIELHWVDALTGQDLNRWFPLTAPSDFLYFLPPRVGVDSAKKLRLISSAGCPGQKGGLSGRFASRGGRWEGLSSQGWRGGEERAGEGSDHFKAVPLSDGYHVLFTDPISGCLCLGNDAPSGGPRKLRRRFTLLGPNADTYELGDAALRMLPSVYAVGGELSWGVRVVAGFGSSIWLFCIPPDVFAHHGNGDREAWKDEYNATTVTHLSDDEAQPIRLRGVEIGKAEGLVDLAIESSPSHSTVWAFVGHGIAYAWQINSGYMRRARKRAVLRDGAVVDLEDPDGDVIMRNAPPLWQRDLDGASSFLPSRRTSDTLALHPANMVGYAERYVEAIPEATWRVEDEGYWSGDDDEERPRAAAFAIHVPPLEGRWSQDGTDWDWDIDHFGMEMGFEGIEEVGSLDILAMSRLEFEIL